MQNAEDEVIKLVEDLVSSYIAGEKSVILVTLPMSGMCFEARFLSSPDGLTVIFRRY